MGNPHETGKVSHTALSLERHNLGNRLAVVLSCFIAVVAANLGELARVAWYRRAGHFLHDNRLAVDRSLGYYVVAMATRPPIRSWLRGIALLLGLSSMAASLVSAADQGVTAADGSNRQAIRAVCTTAMVAEVVREVGGEAVEVTQLMGQGVDPHLYKATASDVKAVSGADIVFISGLMLEGRMGDVFLRTREHGGTVIALSDGVPHHLLMHPQGGHGESDPHIWMDPKVWGCTVDVVRDALARSRPDLASAFAANAAKYRAEIESLISSVQGIVASIPQQHRLLVTAHDAFGYFGRAYGIKVAGLQGISTDSESGLADVKRLVDRIMKSGIGAVFAETSVPDKGVMALVEGVAARGGHIVVGEALFSDAMGAPGTPEGTYRGMILHNARAIARGLSPSEVTSGSNPAVGAQ